MVTLDVSGRHRWAAVPEEDWPQHSAQRDVITGDFDSATDMGDRRQEIVFIGAGTPHPLPCGMIHFKKSHCLGCGSLDRLQLQSLENGCVAITRRGFELDSNAVVHTL